MNEPQTEQTFAGTLLIADRFELRRAGLMSFVTPWASLAGLDVIGIDLSGDCPRIRNGSRMAIVNVGSMSLASAGLDDWVGGFRASAPEAAIVVFGDAHEPQDVLDIFDLGMKGYIPSSMAPSVALQALSFILAGGEFFPPSAMLCGTDCANVRAARSAGPVHSGPIRLTSRQDDVLRLLRLGKPNKVIARELDMQESTVKVHVREIMRKLGVSNRTEAALLSSEADKAQRAEASQDKGAVPPGFERGYGRRADLRLITRT